jgi:hypothetical protein
MQLVAMCWCGRGYRESAVSTASPVITPGTSGFGVMRGDSDYREATANLSVAYKW